MAFLHVEEDVHCLYEMQLYSPRPPPPPEASCLIE